MQGSSTFPITTGSTVNVLQAGVTNTSESLSGTVVSVDSTNTATVRVEVPRYATTVTSAAVVAGAHALPVTDASGYVTPGTATIIDGTSTENVTVSAISDTSLTLSGAGTAFAHAAGVTVEFPFPAATNVLKIGNGTNTETSTVAVNAPPAATYESTAGATLGTLDPGTYTINAYVPGFGFATGSAVTFQSFTNPGGVANSDGVTGTVTVVNGNTATLTVTVPKVRSGPTGDYLTVNGTPGQNALQLNAITNSSTGGNILVGDSLTINADSFYLTPETVTVTGIVGDVVSVTPALADNHTGNATGVGAATITDNSDPQSLNDNVQADITNGTGGVDLVNPFFTFSTAGTITASSLNPVGAGANAAPETFSLSQATPDQTAADWTASSTTAGVTFGAVTAVTNGVPNTISVPINVAAGTPAAASVPVSLTDGLETYSGTIAIVAGPTITSVTAVGDLSAAGGPFTIGVTGTNFVVGDGATPNMSCSTSDPNVTCVVDETVTDTSTTATVTITPHAAMLNGTDSLTLTDSGTVDVGAGPAQRSDLRCGHACWCLHGHRSADRHCSVTRRSFLRASTRPITVTGTAFRGHV